MVANASAKEPSCGFAERSLAGFMDALAPLRPAFDDDSVNEIMVNGPHDVFIRQRGPDRKVEVRLIQTSERIAVGNVANRMVPST